MMQEKIRKIQVELKAPKNQKNTFGNYNYRSLEDICEAVKPLLDKYGLTLTISDEIVNIGDRFYVKATANITDGEKILIVTGFAREAHAKKGMDESQITGAASSYARKYCLNGLFLIDDTRDADSMDNTLKKTTSHKSKNFMTEVQSEKFKKLCQSEQLKVAETANAYGIRYTNNPITAEKFDIIYKVLETNIKTGNVELSLVEE